MPRARLVAIVAAALCGILGRGSAAQNQDQVHLLRGSPASGVILDTSPTEVTVEVRGAKRTIPVNEIRRIGFADDTPDLRRAREDILAGQWENGLEVLKKIDPASLQRDLLRADVQYFIAYCQGRLALTGGGDKAAAATALLEFVKGNPNSYHFYEAAQLLGDLALALDSFENALKYYGAIARAPWPEHKLQGAVLEASVLVAQAKYA